MKYLLSVICKPKEKAWVKKAALIHALKTYDEMVLCDDLYIEFEFLSVNSIINAINKINELSISGIVLTPICLSDDGSWQVLAI